MTFESPLSESKVPDHSSASVESASRARDRVAVMVDAVAESEAASGAPSAPAQTAERIMEALARLGYRPLELSLKPNEIGEWVKRIIDGDFDFAFNLAETLGGVAEGEHLMAAAVELLEIPMTGASAATLLYCLNKGHCAAMLRANGVAVPDWATIDAGDPPPEDWQKFPAIVKPAAEDGSNGIHPSSVVRSMEELRETVARLQADWSDLVIQEFIQGREINLAIVGDQMLPPAEIDFSTLPEGSPPIVSFEAKWMSGSPEDRGTRPICPAQLSPEQVKELQRTAGRAWRVMGGGGYARIDIRLADDGTAYVIDVNPNPDLSLDAGLARQAGVAGWSYDELIGKIVETARIPASGADEVSAEWTFVEPREPAVEPA